MAALEPAEVTQLPLGRLLAVQPVDAREFTDWGSLRSYVQSYALRTNQVRVHSVAIRLVNVRLSLLSLSLYLT